MKRFPKEFRPLVSAVMKSNSFDQAYNSVNSLNEVTKTVANEFYKMYHNVGEYPQESFRKFYNDVRGGRYVFDGELDEIKGHLKKFNLEENIDIYTNALQKHDFYYIHADDRSAYARGKDSEQKLRDIYNSLSDADKLAAAITYKNYMTDNNYFKGTEYGARLSGWKPSENFDPNTFDGARYRG